MVLLNNRGVVVVATLAGVAAFIGLPATVMNTTRLLATPAAMADAIPPCNALGVTAPPLTAQYGDCNTSAPIKGKVVFSPGGKTATLLASGRNTEAAAFWSASQPLPAGTHKLCVSFTLWGRLASALLITDEASVLSPKPGLNHACATAAAGGLWQLLVVVRNAVPDVRLDKVKIS